MISGVNAADVASVPGMAINFSEGKTSHLLTNSFWQLWISFGILGGAIVASIVGFALTKSDVREIGFVLLEAVLMGQAVGGVVITPAWTPLFVIAALTTGWKNSSLRRRWRVGQQLFMMPPNRLSAYSQPAI
jgi:hypothetical protein